MTDQEFQNLCNWADKYKISNFLFPRNKKKLKELKILDITFSKLKELPKEIFKLTNIEKISLYNNELTEIPKEISHFKHLKYLYIDNNLITEIPKELFKLKKLETLNISNNELTELPKEIKIFKKLNLLSVKNNSITELPQEIFFLPSIKTIHIDNNTYIHFKYKTNKELNKIKKIKTDIEKEFLNKRILLYKNEKAMFFENLSEKQQKKYFKEFFKINKIQVEYSEKIKISNLINDFNLNF